MDRSAAVLSAILSVGVIVAAVLGPLGLEIIRFHLNRNAIVQYEGNEVVMILVATALGFAAWRWWEHDALAPALSIGLALFVLYTMVTVVTPQEYEQYPDGNVEKAFLMYFALSALASVLIVLSINRILGLDAPVTGRLRTATQWVMGVEAGIFFLLWISRIVAVYRNGMTDLEKESRALFWLVKYLDLGIAIPIAAITIALLWNHEALGTALVLGFEGFSFVMLLAIAAMSLALVVRNESGGSVVLAIVMMLLAIAPAIIWWKWVEVLADGG